MPTECLAKNFYLLGVCFYSFEEYCNYPGYVSPGYFAADLRRRSTDHYNKSPVWFVPVCFFHIVQRRSPWCQWWWKWSWKFFPNFFFGIIIVERLRGSLENVAPSNAGKEKQKMSESKTRQSWKLGILNASEVSSPIWFDQGMRCGFTGIPMPLELEQSPPEP